VLPIRHGLGTPGPGHYHADAAADELEPNTVAASAAPAVGVTARKGLASTGFRSRSAQHPTHNFGIAKDTPGIGAYETAGDQGMGDVGQKTGSLAPGTRFGNSRFDRFVVTDRQTAAHVGPGSYSPEMGERLARERAKSQGKQGAENFPFSSTSCRDSHITAAMKLQWTGAAVDGEYGGYADE